MGTLVGGAMAGPGVAKQAMQPMQVKSMKLNSSYNENANAVPQTIAYDPIQSARERAEQIRMEINRLTKIANGDFTDHYIQNEEERARNQLKFTRAEHNIYALQSVSDVNKMEMIGNRCREINRVDIIDDAKRRLKDLLKKKIGDLF